MKKSLILTFAVFLIGFLNINSAFAGTCLKNFYGYEVQNVNIREFGVAARNEIDAYKGEGRLVPLKDVKDAYICIYNGSSYFLRVYPAGRNTNIYIVTNEKCDVNKNDVTEFLKRGGYQYAKLTDKAALKEYQFDFYKLEREKKLGNFYISPDLVKPLKVGMTKLNDKLAKKNAKTSVMPYSADANPIDLTCIDTNGYFDSASQIGIIQKEYRLTQKTNKYVHAYEYIVTNKNASTANVTVTSKRVAGLKDATTEAVVDLDRIDLLGSIGSFPPVFICTCGLSLVCSVPSWIRFAKITKEAVRYTHSLPENYQLRSQGVMRILVLKYKDNPQPLKFNIKFPNQTYDIEF